MTTKIAGSIWAYPWDVLDEGVAAFIAAVKERAGLSGVSLAAAYHAGKFLLPHNPRRKVYFSEDGVLYFRPDPGAVQGLKIQPRVSRLLDEGDPLATLGERGDLDLTAWFVALHNTPLGMAHSDCVVRNAFGDPYFFSLCPANPHVQDYLAAVLGDIGTRYDLRAIQLESASYMGFRHRYHHEKEGIALGSRAAHLLSLCFCPSCRNRATRAGLDPDWLQTKVAREIERACAGYQPSVELAGPASLGDPDLDAFSRLRAEIVRGLLCRIRNVVPAHVRIHLIHSGAVEAGWQDGLPLEALDMVDGVIVPAYGLSPAETAERLGKARRLLPPGRDCLAGLTVLEPDCRGGEVLAAQVAAGRTAGIDGTVFYHYGLMHLDRLSWIKEAIK